MSKYHELIRRHCRPLEPIPTGEDAIWHKLPGVRAVLFDIYGTLLISASGDANAAGAPTALAHAFVAALAAVGINTPCPGDEGLACLSDTIRDEHARARQQGIEYPEVEIVDVWRQTLACLAARGKLSPDAEVDVERLAIEYEVRANPVWPMPHLPDCLRGLRRMGCVLGLISNAQFYTMELFPALLDQTLDALGFDGELQIYSYRHGEAKPSHRLFQLAQEALAKREIKPQETLYVGNDMLNDILPAARTGFRTALFAGDARSLRRREGDPRVAGSAPDVVVTDLMGVARCVMPHD